MVGEISPVITERGSADGDGLLSRSGGVGTGILVVVPGGDGEVHTRVDGPVNSIVQSLGHTATQRHVGNGSLVLRLSGSSELGLGSSELLGSLVSGPQNTTDDVGHSATSVGTQDLDGDEVGSLGNPVLAGTDRASAMGTMAVAILIDIIHRDSDSPTGATFKLDVVDVDTSIDDVHVNTVTAGRMVVVESEGSEAELVTVGDARKTLEDGVITNHATRAGFMNVPMEQSAECPRRERRSLVRRKRLPASP